MQTLLYVSRMGLGDELSVRRAHEAFPIAALDRGIGVDKVAVFIGSGLYALELTVADGDVQENLHRFLSAPEVQTLFDRIRPHVKDLPNSDEQTADMPLATAMLVWQSRAKGDLTAV